jgi:hypothetical protein
MAGLAVQAVWDVNTPAAKTFDSAAKASLIVQDLTYLADAFGTGGNAITIEYTAGATATMEVDGVSTATLVKAAVDASVAASALISVSISGTGSNAQAVAAETPLAGGVTSELDITDNEITIPSHGLTSGLKGQLTTTSALPTGFSTSTDYFVLVVDDNTIQLSASLDGAAVNFTTEGTGVHTFTPTAVAGGTIKLQATCSDVNDINVTPVWSDLSGSQSISADGSYLFEKADAFFHHVRLHTTLTAGRVGVVARLNAKGF